MVLIKLLGTLFWKKKKIREYDFRKDCTKIQDLLKESTNDSISNLVYKLNNKDIDTIIDVFNTLHSLVKHSRPLSDSEGSNKVERGKWNRHRQLFTCNNNSRPYCKRNYMKIFKNIIEENAK